MGIGLPVLGQDEVIKYLVALGNRDEMATLHVIFEQLSPVHYSSNLSLLERQLRLFVVCNSLCLQRGQLCIAALVCVPPQTAVKLGSAMSGSGAQSFFPVFPAGPALQHGSEGCRSQLGGLPHLFGFILQLGRQHVGVRSEGHFQVPLYSCQLCPSLLQLIRQLGDSFLEPSGLQKLKVYVLWQRFELPLYAFVGPFSRQRLLRPVVPLVFAVPCMV